MRSPCLSISRIGFVLSAPGFAIWDEIRWVCDLGTYVCDSRLGSLVGTKSAGFKLLLAKVELDLQLAMAVSAGGLRALVRVPKFELLGSYLWAWVLLVCKLEGQ